MQTPDEAGSVPAPDRVKSPWPESQTGSGGELSLTSNSLNGFVPEPRKETVEEAPCQASRLEHFGHPQNVGPLLVLCGAPEAVRCLSTVDNPVPGENDP